MKRYGPTTQFRMGTSSRVVGLGAVLISLIVMPLFSSAQAQIVVDLAPTADGAALGVQPGTATIDVREGVTRDSGGTVLEYGKTQVTFNLAGIPAAAPGTECRINPDQRLLSAWLRFLAPDGSMAPEVAADNLVEPWGPPDAVRPATAPDTCPGISAISGGVVYPVNVNKDQGALTAGCFNPAPNVLNWSPLTRAEAPFTDGMGGMLTLDPNAFLSDPDGEVNARLKTDFDFTDRVAKTTPLVINPWFFGSTVPPFFAQCTVLTAPAPPVCVAAGGVLRSNGSAYKRVYETVLFNDRIGPNGERIPSEVAGIGTPGVMRSLGAVNERSFGRGHIHDIDGPCDNKIVPGVMPCGRSDFGQPGGPPAHPAATDSVGLPAGTIKGQRFQAVDSKGRPVLARAVATHLSVVLHVDCLTKGHIPGNGLGMPQPPPSQGRPADFVEILRGALP